jgi:hypothetical protein
MTKAHLRPCTGCARHIRVSEAACPFCGVEPSAALRASPAPVAPRGRLTRAAIFALGASTAAVGTGCGAQASDTSHVEDSGTSADASGFDAQGGALYGGFPIGEDAGPAMDDAAYGAPPFDAGSQFDAQGGALYGGPGIPLDGGDPVEPDAMVGAAYGGPAYGGPGVPIDEDSGSH